MKRSDVDKVWNTVPIMRPAFILTKDVWRMGGTVKYAKGTYVHGVDRTTYRTVEDSWSQLSCPVNALKFVGYVDINHEASEIRAQFEVLCNE